MKFRFMMVAGLVASVAAGCVETRGPGPSATKLGTGPVKPAVCVDADKDGYGDNCNKGHDCDDHDRTIHTGCKQCGTPNAGCACLLGERPVSCFLDKTVETDGAIMCHEGTRYCRNGAWSECESVFSYPRPAFATTQGILAPDAAPQHCNDCSVDCFIIHDNLDPVDGGLNDANSGSVSFTDGGGLSLTVTYSDASTVVDSGMVNTDACVLGTAPDHDCDGIVDTLDPYPLAKPFATNNPAIVLQIGPGETGIGQINLTFNLNSADIYFLTDMTGSMTGERDNLKSGLTTGNFVGSSPAHCVDDDFDGLPNDEHKTQGIIGAIRCVIRDANFGVGFFREIPFSPSYADVDDIVFRNYQDITSSVASEIAGVNKLDTVGNNDWPEASALALNWLVSGSGAYFGPAKPGIVPRTGCPAGTWGYPCFRSSAIPIVVLFTDAQMHNGPPSNNQAYNASALTQSVGTTTSYQQLGNANETWTNAADLGDLTTQYLSFTGDTTGMQHDLVQSDFGTCASGTDSNGPDALYKFTLSSAKTITATTFGSQFDTLLALYQGIPGSSTNGATNSNTNDTSSAPYDFGTVNNKYILTTGNDMSFASDYTATDVGCSADPSAPDATFKFTLSSATRVALDTSGSSFNTALSLFSTNPATIAYTAVSATNDTFANAYSAGSVDSANKGFSSTTNAGGIAANYTNTQLGSCGAADSSPDSVYTFTVTNPTTVRIATEGSTLPTVVALLDSGSGFPTSAAASGNDKQSNAYNIGALDGKAYQITGSTASLAADFKGSVTGCSAADNGKDAAFKFTLTGTKTVDIDTDSSSFDTVVSLYTGAIAAPATAVTISANTNETFATAYDIGTLDGQKYTVSGGNTGSMNNNYTHAQVVCDSGTWGGAPDAVYKFHLDAATSVQIDTAGSSFDTAIALYNGTPPTTSTTTLSSPSNDTQATAYTVTDPYNADVIYTGGSTSVSGFNANYTIDDGANCYTVATAKDAVFKIVPSVTGSYLISSDGSGFDTVLGLYTSSIAAGPAPTAESGSTGDLLSGAVITNPLDSNWVSFSGNTGNSGFGHEASAFGCSVNANSNDAYYKFHLNAAKNVVLDTIGSGFDTSLGLYKTTGAVYQTCNDNISGSTTDSRISTTTALPIGDYYVVVKGHSSTSSGKGAYILNMRDKAFTAPTACDDNSGSDGTSGSITTTLTGGTTYYAVVKGKTASDSGSYQLEVADSTYKNTNPYLTCHDNVSFSNTTSLISYPNLPAGDYYVIVKGKYSWNSGSYKLTVQDTTNPPNANPATCNDDHGTVNTSLLSPQTLTAGTYYVTVKGKTSTQSGNYTLNIRDDAVSLASALQCDYNSGPGGSSLIERALGAGTYKVVVKGKAATDKNTYKLQLRDIINVTNNRLACDHNSGTGGKSHLEADLSAGTYNVVVKGDTATGAGAYNLSVRDATNIVLTPTPLVCNNDVSGYTTSSISKALNAGTYYIGMKGRTTSAFGPYQLNIGAGTTTSSTYVPPTWAQTLAALQASKAHVMSVISCQDDPSHGNAQGDCNELRTQAKAVANATSALGSNGKELVFDISSSGAGLSTAVVQGIESLAQYLSMDVSVQVAFTPDANPGFQVAVTAVPQVGNGCAGVSGTTHLACAPGATPRFEIAFTNPLSKPVPKNPSDPMGGYNFVAQLIANNAYIVDSVPIYIIPKDAQQSMPPPAPIAPSGTYWQDIPAFGCTNNTEPNWSDLTWNADIPTGTTVSFQVCTATKASLLNTCTYVPVCTITGGAACMTDSNCTAGAFCSSSGYCQKITSGTCSSDAQCGVGSHCLSNTCTFSGQPVNISNALGAMNYQSYLRMQIGLTANTTANTGPTVHDWSLTYLCHASL